MNPSSSLAARLFSLSAWQRVLLMLPLLAAIWLLTVWALGLVNG